ncbi:hypothetical protein [Microbacterium sp. NPDC087589]|uniref:hypothetical protein n=1 Tax=Microbacterium sp. NPDC087589 TaxID=3364191 RepID=UPI0038187812
MTELAYMTYTDWAAGGTGMAQRGSRIREWLGGEPFIFLDPAPGKRRSADAAVFASIVPPDARQVVTSFAEFDAAGQQTLDHGVTVMFPFEERECESLRELIVSARVRRIFVMVWSPTHLVIEMLDGLGGMNLLTERPAPRVGPLQLEAAKAMVSEQYNGLESGYGKDAVIQLLRAMSNEGYLLDERWIHAVFMAGATYRSAESVAKFLREMNRGVKHRVQPRFVPDIVRVLRANLDKADSA